MSTEPPDLNVLVANARKQWAELPRHEQLRIERECKISWIHAQLRTTCPGVTRARVSEIIEAHEKGRLA